MKNSTVKNLSLASMFLAIGLVLPFFTGQIPQIGKMLLPMHIPIFLCALICGWKYGLCIGLILPLLRSFLFGMPVMFPSAVTMSFELAAYAFIAGYLYAHSRWQCIVALYRCLLIAMIGGRLVAALVKLVLLGLFGTPFTLEAFIAGSFVNAIPGIIVQLTVIPAIMLALHRTGLVSFHKNAKSCESTKS